MKWNEQLVKYMGGTMRNLTHLLLFFSLLLGGCQSLTSPLANEANAISLIPCSVANGAIKAECGYLHVPEDRAHPNGRMLDLKIVVVRAYGSNPEPDPLFYITGGPGGIDTDPEVVITANNWFRDVNAQRDIVYLDQRGTNELHRLTCEPIPTEVANGSQQQMNDWMKQCLANLNGDPRFYTTAEAMRDLDEARAALGYDKINLYGGSYGASAVQVYMRMFPEHVRTAVMDHGTALDLPFFQALPNASQSALDQVFTYCEQDEKCHAAYPNIRGDWKAVLDRLAKGPVITSYTRPGASAPEQVDMDNFTDSVHNLLFISGGYAGISNVIHALAIEEDWTPIVKSLIEQYDSSDSPAEGPLLMENMIFCFEPAWGNTPDEIARLNPDSYLRDLQVKKAQDQEKICAALPKPDPALLYGPGKPAPLSALLLNSLIDPQNPPSNMELALKEFTKSRMVIEPTEGHTTSDSACRWGIVAQYIEQGSVDGLDTSCMEQQKPSFVIGN